MKPPDVTWQDYIKALRKSLQMNREQFCVAVGCSWQTLYMWERGIREPDAEHQAAIEVVAAEVSEEGEP